MAKSFFKRYIWLVDLLSRRGYISLKEISNEQPSSVCSVGVVIVRDGEISDKYQQVQYWYARRSVPFQQRIIPQ